MLQDELNEIEVCRPSVKGDGDAGLSTAFVAGRATSVAQLTGVDDVNAAPRTFNEPKSVETICEARVARGGGHVEDVIGPHSLDEPARVLYQNPVQVELDVDGA
jgi:hypothetical protein